MNHNLIWNIEYRNNLQLMHVINIYIRFNLMCHSIINPTLKDLSSQCLEHCFTHTLLYPPTFVSFRIYLLSSLDRMFNYCSKIIFPKTLSTYLFIFFFFFNENKISFSKAGLVKWRFRQVAHEMFFHNNSVFLSSFLYPCFLVSIFSRQERK